MGPCWWAVAFGGQFEVLGELVDGGADAEVAVGGGVGVEVGVEPVADWGGGGSACSDEDAVGAGGLVGGGVGVVDGVVDGGHGGTNLLGGRCFGLNAHQWHPVRGSVAGSGTGVPL